MRHTNYDIGRAGWIGDYHGPQHVSGLFSPRDSGNNETGWSNAEYDHLCEAGRQILAIRRRASPTFKKPRPILMDEMPIIPIYFYTMPRLIRPSVKGWYPNLLDQHNYKSIYLDPKAD